MAGIDEILEQARAIGEGGDWDGAAKFLAPWRKHYVSEGGEDTANLDALTAIVTLQMESLRRAGKCDVACGIGEWFHHILHDLPAVRPGDPSRERLREPLSRMFREYAKCLCASDRFEEMRLAMRSALDATRMLPMAVVALIHLYAPLEKRCTMIEGEPSRQWLLKRYAECLAMLDFAGLSQTAFRATLDDYQAALRDESARSALYADVAARNVPDDLALNTITRLFEAHFMQP